MGWQILGQQKAIDLLQGSIKIGQLSHAYLFIAPPHVGKMTLSLNLAQALNCDSDDPPCGECSTCRRIAAGKYPDVQVIGVATEGKTDIGIDQIRELQAMASLPPFEGKYKIFLIAGAEHLSIEAANCLLKILEEPLPSILLLLLTDKQHLVLPTIVSRCQCIRLTPLPMSSIKSILIDRYETDEQKAELVAHLSHGCLGWALSAIEDEQHLQHRTTALDAFNELMEASYTHRFSYASDLASAFGKNRSHVENVFALWIDWWRDLLLLKTGNDEYITNVDYQSVLQGIAERCRLSQIQSFIQSIQTAAIQLGQNANSRLVLETLVLDMPVIHRA